MKIILSTLNAKYIHSSLALRYIKSFSEVDFSDIEIVEYSINEPIMNMVSDIYNKAPDVIGFSCYIWNIEETIKLIRLMKKVMPRVKMIVGGPEVTYDIDYWLHRVKEIDFIVYGEGEATFKHLINVIKSQGNLKNVTGIAYLSNERVIINPPREKLELDMIPSPYNDSNDLESLTDKIVYFEASRGCPFSCAYCLSSIETGVRYFSIERVKEDLLRLIKRGVKIIKFVDRTFNIHKKFALEIFQFLIDNHGGTIFQFEITADIMKPDVLQFLVDHAPKHVFRFEIGVQSTNENTNSLINRRQNFEKLSYTVLKLKESGKIDQHLDLIAGLPEEDYESIKKTFNDVFILRPEELQLGFLKLLRGTPISYEVKKYNYIYMDKAPYEMLQNNTLSFDDVIRIKRVEDILEKYWNSHKFDYTVEYLISHEFTSPFDFFQEFGDYWEGKGWNRIGHQFESLFIRLKEFLSNRDTQRIELIFDLMKIDYFLHHKYKPRNIWWDFKMNKQEQTAILKELIENPVSEDFIALQLNEKNIHKHIMIDMLEYDLEKFFLENQIQKQKTLFIIYYHAPNKPMYFFKKINSK